MKKLLTFVISLLVLVTPAIAAEETGITEPGFTPDNPIYGLDRAMERLQLALTFGEANKAELHYRFAEERLAEANAMGDKDEKHTREMIREYENELNETEIEMEKAVARGQNVSELIERVSQKTAKHIAVLQRVYDKVPEQARESIAKAMEVSTRKQIGILERLENGETIRTRVRAEIGEELEKGEGTPESVKQKVRERFEEDSNEIESETEIEDENETEIENGSDDNSENENSQEQKGKA